MQGDYSAAVYDVVMTQGDTFEEQFVFRDTDGTCWRSAGTRSSRRSAVRLLRRLLCCATMTCTVDTDTATVTRTIGTAVTSGIAPGVYVHDMHWMDP